MTLHDLTTSMSECKLEEQDHQPDMDVPIAALLAGLSIHGTGVPSSESSSEARFKVTLPVLPPRPSMACINALLGQGAGPALPRPPIKDTPTTAAKTGASEDQNALFRLMFMMLLERGRTDPEMLDLLWRVPKGRGTQAEEERLRVEARDVLAEIRRRENEGAGNG
ncbi:hypothetical protein QBC43DRAFT_289042 [Cladorrhinum sp. PSN259]|nr:hypothetical protein QBC43DRAFT_289042 [Cladorrhinum sp. PSN259]